MHTEQTAIDMGRLSIEIPADCPEVSAFQAVIMDELNASFSGDIERAAFCKAEFDRCQHTPAPFFYHRVAESHYGAAQTALSPAAQSWQQFEHNVTNRFSKYSLDDGCDQSPAIPGWRLGELKASVRGQLREQAPVRMAEPRQPQARTWRLDQMTIREQSTSGSWRDRRPPSDKAKTPSRDKGNGRAR